MFTEQFIDQVEQLEVMYPEMYIHEPNLIIEDEEWYE